MLSDAEDEYDEMLLKAQPLLDAVSLSGTRGGVRSRFGAAAQHRACEQQR
jgi:hypothetical protein